MAPKRKETISSSSKKSSISQTAKKKKLEKGKEVISEKPQKIAKGKGPTLISNPIIPSRTIDWKYFGDPRLPYRGWFEAQGWMGFMKICTVVFPNVVRQAYSSIKEAGSDGIEILLNGQKFTITQETLSKAFNIPNTGAKLYKKGEMKIKGYSEAEFKEEVLGTAGSSKSGKVRSAELKTHSRVLHKFITNFIAPKAGSFDYVTANELCLMWHIQKRNDVNLCYLMMNVMKSVNLKKGLPYGMILSVLFEYLNVDLEKEDCVVVNEKRIIDKKFVTKTKVQKEFGGTAVDRKIEIDESSDEGEKSEGMEESEDNLSEKEKKEVESEDHGEEEEVKVDESSESEEKSEESINDEEEEKSAENSQESDEVEEVELDVQIAKEATPSKQKKVALKTAQAGMTELQKEKVRSEEVKSEKETKEQTGIEVEMVEVDKEGNEARVELDTLKKIAEEMTKAVSSFTETTNAILKLGTKHGAKTSQSEVGDHEVYWKKFVEASEQGFKLLMESCEASFKQLIKEVEEKSRATLSSSQKEEDIGKSDAAPVEKGEISKTDIPHTVTSLHQATPVTRLSKGTKSSIDLNITPAPHSRATSSALPKASSSVVKRTGKRRKTTRGVAPGDDRLSDDSSLA